MQEIRVMLGERSYDVVIGSDMLSGLAGRLKDFAFSRMVIVSNPTVYGLHGKALLSALSSAGFDAPVILVPDGEEYKELLWAYYIYGGLLKQKLDRASAVVALGGGVIGDISGFVASTYMRGISFIQVPTTLLAQVDSSVGGKTGVNHPLGKNMIGTFHQPRIVWADVSTLRTLPRRELLAGMAEVIKYGVICDEALFRFLEEKREKILGLDGGAVEHLVKRSCEIKADVVSKDERETGLRAILNYGHTVGHAIETVTGYSEYLHGEAVAIGMCLEAEISSLLGIMDRREVERIRSLVTSYGLPCRMPSEIDAGGLTAAMLHDKKTVAGRLKFILPERIGSVRTETVIDTARIIEAIRG
ncbi:MAG TPA: 3-dehydroquinate synthase [Thermodesulfovibrionales bacterium]|nr:3-dehydroquinate synthase [Thermodesulfovibrionales bacterium]